MEATMVQIVSFIPKMVGEQGLTITISALFLIMTVFMVRYFGKRIARMDEVLYGENKQSSLEARMKEFAERLDRLSASLEETKAKIASIPALQGKEAKIKLPITQLDIGEKINNILRDTLESQRADRADVFIFSNGKVSTSGSFDFLRFNHSFAYLRNGSSIKALEELPFTFLTSFFSEMAKNKDIVIDSQEKVNGYNQIVKTWIEGAGAETIVFSLIKNEIDVFGFMVLCFDGDSSKLVDKEKVVSEMQKSATKISFIIG